MQTRKKVIAIAVPVAAIVLAAGLYGAWAVVSDTPDKARLREAVDAPGADRADPNGTWRVAPGSNSFVGYRVRERLGNVPAPSDAVGRSTAVTATVVIDANRLTKVEVSVDMAQLRSDVPGRDETLREQGLETDTFPTAGFTSTQPVDLPTPTPRGKVVDLSVPGRLTLHGVTKDVTLTLQARWDGGTIQVAGSIPIRRADFNIAVFGIAGFRIDDAGVAEVELTLAPDGTTKLGTPPTTLRPDAATRTGHPEEPPCQANGVLPPGGGRLAVSLTSDESPSITTISASGTGAATPAPTEATDPAWSPDGRRLAYATAPQGEGLPRIGVMNADGTGAAPVPGAEPGTQPDWSPDGRTLAFTRGTETGSEIWTVPTAGGAARKVAGDTTFADEPRWSPDGKTIAFSGYGGSAANQDVYLVNANGSGLRRLTTAPGYEYSPSWTPDGRGIVFVKDGAITVIGVDGANERKLTDGPRDGAPHMSKDGTRISFVRGLSIYVMKADGTGAACLPLGRSVQSGAVWAS